MKNIPLLCALKVICYSRNTHEKLYEYLAKIDNYADVTKNFVYFLLNDAFVQIKDSANDDSKIDISELEQILTISQNTDDFNKTQGYFKKINKLLEDIGDKAFKSIDPTYIPPQTDNIAFKYTTMKPIESHELARIIGKQEDSPTKQNLFFYIKIENTWYCLMDGNLIPIEIDAPPKHSYYFYNFKPKYIFIYEYSNQSYSLKESIPILDDTNLNDIDNRNHENGYVIEYFRRDWFTSYMPPQKDKNIAMIKYRQTERPGKDPKDGERMINGEKYIKDSKLVTSNDTDNYFSKITQKTAQNEIKHVHESVNSSIRTENIVQKPKYRFIFMKPPNLYYYKLESQFSYKYEVEDCAKTIFGMQNPILLYVEKGDLQEAKFLDEDKTYVVQDASVNQRFYQVILVETLTPKIITTPLCFYNGKEYLTNPAIKEAFSLENSTKIYQNNRGQIESGYKLNIALPNYIQVQNMPKIIETSGK